MAYTRHQSFILLWFWVGFFFSNKIIAQKDNIHDRLDCWLIEDQINETECRQKSCVWAPSNETQGIPNCYLQRDLIGYILSNSSTTPNGFESFLTLKQTAQKSIQFEQLSKLKLTVSYLSNYIVRFRIVDPVNKRYEVPVSINLNLPKPTNERLYNVSLQKEFNFTIIRNDNQDKIIDTSIGGLLYADQFIQFATYLPTKDIYGFGENYHTTYRHENQYRTYPMFARSRHVGNPNGNNYGVHPFFIGVGLDGKSFGIFLMNSNAQSITILPSPGLSWKTSGGVLDFFVFVGENPEHVVQLYTSVVGRPTMPPFWGLGFQLSRFGYKNVNHVKKVMDRNLKHNVPLDVQYLDSDYMEKSRVFTVDNVEFKNISHFINETKHQHNLHWALIIDPGIEASYPEYFAFEEGYKKDVFLKWPKNYTPSKHPDRVPLDKNVLYGKVWPDGPVAFPDFFKNVTQEWWIDMIKRLHQQVSFDALWIDMNEPALYNVNYLQCPQSKYSWKRVSQNFLDRLDSRTVCMNAVQGNDDQYLHYDVHSLYGWSEGVPTQRGVHQATGKRGFVVSRSTFPSSAKHVAHWLGDNNSSWEHLRQSIISLLEFSLFGFSFVGPDICGFSLNAEAELCRRWLQLGAFYPFSRSHNEHRRIDQDPGVWVERKHPEVTKSAVTALQTRYKFLHYLYTGFFRSSVFGETLARPVLHEFLLDQKARTLDQQFMLGRSIMVTPFLYPNQTSLKAYLPNTRNWFKLMGSFVEKALVDQHTNQTQLNDIDSDRPIFLSGGSILPVVNKLPMPLNTVSLREAPIELWILPDHGFAVGDLFFDDGESIDTIATAQFNYYKFQFQNCQLNITVAQNNYVQHEPTLRIDGIRIPLLDLKKPITSEQVVVKVPGYGIWNSTIIDQNGQMHLHIDGHIVLTEPAIIRHGILLTVTDKSNKCFIN